MALTEIPVAPNSQPEAFVIPSIADFYTGHILYADGGYTAG